MAIHSSIGLGGAALCALLLSASAAVAERESGVAEQTKPAQQITALACDVSDDAAVTEGCAGVLMRWRLCERGFDAARLSRAGLYKCFID